MKITLETSEEAKSTLETSEVHSKRVEIQHSPDVTNDQIQKDVLEYIIKPVVPEKCYQPHSFRV